MKLSALSKKSGLPSRLSPILMCGERARQIDGGQAMPLFQQPHYQRRRHGALRKDASSGSKPLLTVPRPESRAALQRPHGFHYLLFRQIAARAACSAGVDADLRRVPCRAFKSSTGHGARILNCPFRLNVENTPGPV